MATIHTFTGNEVIATEVPQYLNQNFSGINTEVTNLSKDAVKTINGNKATNNNINISEFDSYWKAGEVVTIGDVRFLKGRDNTGIVLECVQTGTTGSNQPTVSDYVGMGGNGGEIDAVLSAIETVQTQVNTVSNKITSISDYIIESYHNGTEWYEVYKSGKVRQGGVATLGSGSYNRVATVTFLKKFKDTQYTLTVTAESDDLNFGYYKSKTTTNCVVGSNVKANTNSKDKADWVAEGQGA